LSCFEEWRAGESIVDWGESCGSEILLIYFVNEQSVEIWRRGVHVVGFLCDAAEIFRYRFRKCISRKMHKLKPYSSILRANIFKFICIHKVLREPSLNLGCAKI
jgi:hypothetical protein